jgi:transketolase
LVLTRQKVAVIDRDGRGAAEGLRRGAYVLSGFSRDPDVVLMASGSEVALALEAADRLADAQIRARVVAMPCWELFEAQDQSYRDEVLARHVTARVSIEAGVSLGWERYVGDRGVVIAIDRFGASAPGSTVLEELGITADRVVEAARSLVR